jgi:galactose-3-O-sulfotransferase
MSLGAEQRSPEQVAPRWLVFLHVPRTAGTTFVHILERQYGGDGVLRLYDSTFGDELAALSRDELDRVRVVAGHFYFGAHVHLPGPCRYLTFLRDPVERVISHYYFVRRQPEHYLHTAASNMGLAEYVESCGRAEPNNDQTRLLAGRALATSDGAWSPEMFDAAVSNLDNHFVVGLTEEFDASLVSMRRLVRWNRPALYVARNVGARPTDGEVSADVHQLIRSYNALDVELYRHGRERFDRQLAAHGSALTREIRLFRVLNRLYALSQRGSGWRRKSLRAA